jgi:hypothetical protein
MHIGIYFWWVLIFADLRVYLQKILCSEYANDNDDDDDVSGVLVFKF